MKARLHAIIRGRVQGVGFRYFVADAARDLKLAGTVQNRFDGTVELVAEGERETLETLLAACRQGPPMSMVREVTEEWSNATGDFKGFGIG